MNRCANCEEEVPVDPPDGGRKPCPHCGATARTVEVAASIYAQAQVAVQASVNRGVNEARMAAFVLIFATGTGLGVSVGFVSGALVGVLAGVGAACSTVVVLTAIYRVRFVRNGVMSVMHRITGQ